MKLTKRYAEMLRNGEITEEQALAYSEEMFEMMDADKKAVELRHAKKREQFEEAQKKAAVSDRDILAVIDAYRLGRSMSKRTLERLDAVQALFNDQFRCCKGGSVFCWKEYFAIYGMSL